MSLLIEVEGMLKKARAFVSGESQHLREELHKELTDLLVLVGIENAPPAEEAAPVVADTSKAI